MNIMTTGKKCPVTIHDYGCGYGKTTMMIEGFTDNERYLVIVPYISEVTWTIDRDMIVFTEQVAYWEGEE